MKYDINLYTLKLVPAKNTVKTYVEHGYYHIYNRGVEKRDIFLDKQDYGVFLSQIKTYLSPRNEDELLQSLSNPLLPWKEKSKILKILRLNNFSDNISLLCYCLMPNHFHFLVKQQSREAIDSFMNSLNTRYVMYFNKKYQRVGPLYQGSYKAVLVNTDEQLLYLSAYIHRNFLETVGQVLQGDSLKILQALQKQPSSLPEYLALRNTSWIETKTILSYFSSKNPGLSYSKFIFGYKSNQIIQNLLLD